MSATAAAAPRDPRLESLRRASNAARRMRFWARCYVRRDAVGLLERELDAEEALIRTELDAVAAAL